MRVFIGLGGNLGEPAVAFRAAASELRGIGQVVRTSSLYDTAPRDSLDQPNFLNAALELETDLEPAELLNALKRLELALGRDPQGRRWAPRVLDLDILVIDGRCITDPEHDLIVPHPRLQERRFALEPLAELDPGLLPWRDCADLRVEVSVADLLPTVAGQEVLRVGGPDWADPVSGGARN
ncbi:MAG: 2-amino-4-hydroxy-6-hydroxymethyldihydropteridine diphosphokinase [Candidatus Limnocylindria bacterium]